MAHMAVYVVAHRSKCRRSAGVGTEVTPPSTSEPVLVAQSFRMGVHIVRDGSVALVGEMGPPVEARVLVALTLRSDAHLLEILRGPWDDVRLELIPQPRQPRSQPQCALRVG